MERNTWRLGARDRISGNVHCIAITAGHQTLRKKVRTALVERGVTYIAKVGRSGLENGTISSPSCQS